MIISRTPYRLSFFGGGTDYPAFYNENGGTVLATTFDKYCYITCRYLPPFFKHRYRVVWSKIELVDSVEQIVHPSVRECLKYLNIDGGIEIHHDGDLPARSGIGSSSTFTVGLLNALNAYKGEMISCQRLAKEAIFIEQECIGEHVGAQDQTMAAHGGFNRIDFQSSGQITVRPVVVSAERLQEFQDHLMLFFTGLPRSAASTAEKWIRMIPKRSRELHAMKAMVDEALTILTGNGNIGDFGRLMHEGWQLKRSLAKGVSTPQIDDVYMAARKAGALGGKITGAGGGGFFLFFAPPQAHLNVRKALGKLLFVPVKFESAGSRIIFFEPEKNYYRYDSKNRSYIYDTVKK